ncbi:MAG TPA: LacI family DNA-binding transcriptional regulator [Phototrophicaceae bacterium]|nr:LacI family DNA-binding transcriptional regulator [Phototrophicaceae bacterium]
MSVNRKQVAAYAAVSEATVSYVINNGPRPVAPETRERVLRAIRELGYSPSTVARNLRAQRTTTMGLLLPDIINPFYAEVAQVIENTCFAHGYTTILCNSSQSQQHEQDYVNMLRAQRAAGVILIPIGANTHAVRQLREANIPTVVLEYEFDNAFCLVIDELRGGLLLTQHLLQLGHRRIGCIASIEDSSSSKVRFEGYIKALNQAEVVPDESLIVHTHQEIAASEAATFTLLDLPEPPTAIFVHNDRLALGALSAIRKRGLRVPEDISVVGYDNVVEAAFFHPPLTTIDYPKHQIGEEAVRLLFDLIGQPDPALKPVTKMLPVELIVRESTAPPRRL